jgi:hypothetical protein
MRLLFAAILALSLAGCASTNTKSAIPPEAATLPYPKAIYVYDFAVSPTEVASGSVAAPRLSGATDDPTKTAQRDELEREISGALAAQLVAQIQDLGLPAVRWRGKPPLNEDSYIIEGQFLTIGAAGAPDQKIIGLGLGGSELQVLAQAYYVQGSQKELLGEAEVTGTGTEAPGLAAALPLAKLSASRAASSVATGAGVVRSVTTKVKKGAEVTAASVVEQLKPKLQAEGWL